MTVELIRSDRALGKIECIALDRPFDHDQSLAIDLALIVFEAAIDAAGNDPRRGKLLDRFRSALDDLPTADLARFVLLVEARVRARLRSAA